MIYEVLWFRLASLVFGNSVWGAALVLSGFMAGLALGSYLIARHGFRVTSPLLIYAVMEITIGCAGFLVVMILPGLQEAFSLLFRPFLDHLILLNLIRVLLVFIILLLPTMLMGATLPIMVKSLVNRDKDFGTVLGALYGINTLGAVTGVLVCEYWLIKVLGIRNSGMMAAAINLVVAAIALRLASYPGIISRPARIGAEDASIKQIMSPEHRNLFVSTFLSGLALLALEVVWFRFLQLFQFGTSQIFATMLAIVLSGIGFGGLIASYCHRNKIITENHLGMLALTGGFLTLATYIFFDEFYFSLSILSPSFTTLLLYNFFLMFPVSVVSGVLFTLLGIAIKKNDLTDTGTAGLLVLVNTTGAMCGSLLAGFVLLPMLGMEYSFYVLSLCYGLIALLVAGRPVTQGVKYIYLKPGFIAATIYLAALVFFPFGEMHSTYFKQVVSRFSASRIVDVREGTVATNINLAYDFYGKPLFYKLVTNNHSMTATSVYGRRYMKLFVYLPVAIHPGIDNALLISFGQGSTAKALVDTASIKSIDIVDISREIIAMSDQIYATDGNPIKDKRVNVHIEDGRFFLLTTPHQYDLITAEPPPPKAIGVVNLYTEEYFRLIHERLREQGVATYWLPTQSLTPSDSKAIIKAFCNVFRDCSLWNGAGMDWILMGTKNLAGRVTEQHFSRQWENPGVAGELKTIGMENAGQLGAIFLADADFLNKLTANSMPLSDNYPSRLSPYLSGFTVDYNSAFYFPLMEEAGAEYRFAHSEYIRKIWPHLWRQKAMDYFKYQRLINKQFITSYGGEHGHPLKDLHDVLVHTSLESLPLWMMRSDDDKQEIIRRLVEENVRIPAIPLHLAMLSISRRDYAAAMAWLDQYHILAAGKVEISAHTLYLYLLCLTGQTAKANSYLQEIISLFPPSKKNIIFIAWFRDNFGLDIPKGYVH